jgi:hypothetical protein
MEAGFTTDAAKPHERDVRMPDAVRGALVVAGGATIMLGMAFGAMMLLTSPDGWVMKAANQAMSTAQQGTLATYDIAFDR